ncbi:MAG: hypothetical protein G8345_02970 [Magnetococcales bacterium]|nr:hypothetical protein [Magnetococcales bacterium]NGZ25835.1 hypothetical protein [Magnetococcales bacterium]
MSGTTINSIPVYDPNGPVYAEKDKSTQELQENFFTMLTAQLEYQDPLKPMENVEFTNQMIGFYGLQQQQANTALLQKMVDNTTGEGLNQGVSYLGRMLTVESNGVNITNGAGAVGFETDQPFIGHISIYNSEDQLVKTLPDQTFESGAHNVNLQDTGLETGFYRFRVVPASESTAAITHLERGMASGVSNEGGNILLRVNNHNVSLSQIREVEMNSTS